ncbi:MAG: hypothetical protein V4671_16825 [Armatimonadota bacterium]
MDKTAKLIRWQQAAILCLVVVTITTALMLRNEQQGKARLMLNLQSAAGMLDQRDERHRADEKIIRDLDERLRQYEKRFGEIQPVRRGEGIYIRQSGSLPSPMPR